MNVENFKRFSLKMLRCEAGAFPVGTAYSCMTSRPFFTQWKMCMRMNLGEMFFASSIIDWQYKYASNKGMPAV